MEDWGRVNRCALIQLDLSTAVARLGTPSPQTAIIAKTLMSVRQTAGWDHVSSCAPTHQVHFIAAVYQGTSCAMTV